MALQAQLVLLLAGNLVAGGDIFRGDAHMIAVKDFIQGVKHHQINGFAERHIHAVAPAGLGQADGHVAHVFHAARDHHFVVAGLDGGGGQRDGFHAGGANLVDGDGGRFLGKAGADHGLASDVLPLAGADDVAHDDLINGKLPESVIPFAVLLLDGAKAFVFGRIRRVLPGMRRQSRLETGFNQRFTNHQRSQVFGGNAFQRAAEGSNRGAHTADNDCI